MVVEGEFFDSVATPIMEITAKGPGFTLLFPTVSIAQHLFQFTNMI